LSLHIARAFKPHQIEAVRTAEYLQSYLEVGCAGLEREMTNIEVPR
jgi:hypothetical protein